MNQNKSHTNMICICNKSQQIFLNEAALTKSEGGGHGLPSDGSAHEAGRGGFDTATDAAVVSGAAVLTHGDATSSVKLSVILIVRHEYRVFHK